MFKLITAIARALPLALPGCSIYKAATITIFKVTKKNGLQGCT